MRPADPFIASRALVVDDHPSCRDALTDLLHLEGLAVTSASTAREAIAAARGQIFDIVFTDLGLPDMSGPALLRELAATAQGDPRLIVITGAGEADIMEARRAGAEVVFTKPFEWDLVRTYLQRSTAAR